MVGTAGLIDNIVQRPTTPTGPAPSPCRPATPATSSTSLQNERAAGDHAARRRRRRGKADGQGRRTSSRSSRPTRRSTPVPAEPRRARRPAGRPPRRCSTRSTTQLGEPAGDARRRSGPRQDPAVQRRERRYQRARSPTCSTSATSPPSSPATRPERPACAPPPRVAEREGVPVAGAGRRAAGAAPDGAMTAAACDSDYIAALDRPGAGAATTFNAVADRGRSASCSTRPSPARDLREVAAVRGPARRRWRTDERRTTGVHRRPTGTRAMVGQADLMRKVEIAARRAGVSRPPTDLRRPACSARCSSRPACCCACCCSAILFAWLVARSMARSLRELRHGALAVAQYGLPQAVARLRDPALSTQMSPDQVAQQIAEPLPVRSKDEFGQVTEAFNAVHLEAVRTAAEQAALRASRRDDVRQPGPPSPDPGRPADRSPRPAGARRGGPGPAGRAVPARPPGHPDAPQRREPAGARRRRLDPHPARAGRR